MGFFFFLSIKKKKNFCHLSIFRILHIKETKNAINEILSGIKLNRLHDDLLIEIDLNNYVPIFRICGETKIR